jgi:hypothetical protein
MNRQKPSNLPAHTTLRSARLALVVLCLLVLTGCLEQYQSPRLPGGALHNFLLHLQNGELDDARTYFAPGLVTPSAELDASIQEASNRIKRFDFRRMKATSQDLEAGEKQVTINGQARRRTPPGQPTPGPDEGWQDTDIITARMVERGPGWRLYDFEILCCENGEQ